MKSLINLLINYPAIDALLNGKKKIVSNDNTKEAILIATAYNKKPSKLVIVKNNLFAAQRLYERLDGLVDSSKVLFFPVDESFRIEALATSPELLTQRIYVLNKLLEEENYIVITHTAAMVRILPSIEIFKSNRVNLKVNDEISMNNLMRSLTNMGYSRVNKIEHSLQFAQRGGVLDVYSVNNDNPIRIEFFGDEIDSIRFFDLDSQRTIETIKQVQIISASDLIVDSTTFDNKLSELESKLDMNSPNYDIFKNEINDLKERNSYSLMYKYYTKLQAKYGCLFDYTFGARVIFSHVNDIRENFNLLMNESFEYLEEQNDTSFILYHNLETVMDIPKNSTQIELFRSSDSMVEFPLKDVESANGNIRQVKLLIDEYLKRKYKIVLCLDNPNQISCVKDWMNEWEYELKYVPNDKMPEDGIYYTDFTIKEGFEITEEKIIYLGAFELFGMRAASKKTYTRYRDGIAIQSYDNLEIGDYVVHEVHGIGQYLGIKTMEFDGIHKDYLHIQYRGSDVLYVPLEQFKLVRKYVSKQGIVPKLNKLGSSEWEKTKTKIKKRIEDITDRLVTLYMNRTKAVGFACEKDDEWQIQFENSFPYELTADQKRSVDEIKKDMEQPYPMDRLLCGDVGFGKTEVAFIAAFKAILNGKQVAMLCPTTLLARQHFEVAKERFQNFPVNIGLLSRMVPMKEQNHYMSMAKDGSMNLLIGTHRLLSKDLKFKDLGLLIIDEEHRFGVEHKEKIKELKENIDVLTLSATPIPRTLQSSLLGLRSLSQIDTPPQNRMPIQTYVVEKNFRLIKEIIERELSRGGQVFYLHNRVGDLFELAKKIKDSIPGADVVTIHGKMSPEESEDVMIDFSSGNANVMICTTIIENGIDIPNANTIIIEDADKFGLSQLYQIKGRVGRGDRLGYAYLLYNGNKQLSEVATKRLNAIKEFAELGSGYRIAMRDLTIRGAGDILGSEQAGFIDTVGMDMYIQMLQEAINEKKYGPRPVEEEVKIKNVKLDAYIPKQFTNDDLDKIDLYKKINTTKTKEDLYLLEKEMIDIYGKLPHSVKLLLEKRRFELFVKSEVVDDIRDLEKDYEIILSDMVSEFDGIGVDLFAICNEISSKIQITYKSRKLRIKIPKTLKDWLNMANELMNRIQNLVAQYKSKTIDK